MITVYCIECGLRPVNTLTDMCFECASGVQNQRAISQKPMGPSIGDVYAEALDRLTRSTDALRGSVDRLCEIGERMSAEEAPMSPDAEPMIGTVERKAEKNRVTTERVELLAVKRGPITEDEVVNSVEAWRNGGFYSSDSMKCALETFARARGIL